MTRLRPDRLRLAAALAVSLALASSASAQPQRPVHHIRIQEQGDQCVYRIAEQEEQDAFVVPPSGKVIFQPIRGVKATAVITASESVWSSSDRSASIGITVTCSKAVAASAGESGPGVVWAHPSTGTLAIRKAIQREQSENDMGALDDGAVPGNVR